MLFSGATFTSPALTANTTYYAEAVDPATQARSARITATVTVNPAPDLAVVPPTQSVSAGRMASFTASSTTPGAIFNWYASATDTTPLFTGAQFTTPPISSVTEFFVEAVNPATGAASVRAQVEVRVDAGEPLVFVPTGFSPNGDGNNDTLKPLGAVISNYDMRVFNQWGQMIFRTTDYNQGWDSTWRGADQPVGVYVYYMRGIAGEKGKIDIKGTVTLIR